MFIEGVLYRITSDVNFWNDSLKTGDLLRCINVSEDLFYSKKVGHQWGTVSKGFKYNKLFPVYGISQHKLGAFYG